MRLVFTIGLELVFIYVVVFYFWALLSLDIIHAKYFRRTLSLKGLLRHLSKGCKTGVRPPGIIATSMFRWLRSPFTELVKWAWNESHTRRECSPHSKLCLIHSLTPCSSIQPLLWKETQRGCSTTRSLGVWTPLKMPFGDNFVPSAATVRAPVKLRFSLALSCLMEARNAWVSYPYCRCAIKGSQLVFKLQSQSGETAQCFLRGRQVMAVAVLFSIACRASGVVSISGTTHGKLWRTDHLTILWL